MGFIIANAISVVKTFIAGVSRSSILALSGLIAFIFDAEEGVSSTYVGDAAGDDRTSGREIQPGRCYDFDGTNDYVNIGAISAIETADFSIKLRVKNTETNEGHFFSLGTGGSDGTFLLRKLGSGVVNCAIFLNGTSASVGSTTVVNDGAWHTIAVSVDRDGNLTLNINDGAEIASTSISSLNGFSLNNGNGWAIGCERAGAPTQFYDGIIQYLEVREGATIDSGNYVALYKMEESAGAIAYDSSGNANHGTITNATLSTFHATDTGVTKSYSNDVGYNDGNNNFPVSSVTSPGWVNQLTGLSLVDFKSSGNFALRFTNTDLTNAVHRSYNITNIVNFEQDDWLIVYAKNNGSRYFSYRITGGGVATYDFTTESFSTLTGFANQSIEVNGDWHKLTLQHNQSFSNPIVQFAHSGTTALTRPDIAHTPDSITTSIDFFIGVLKENSGQIVPTFGSQVVNKLIPRNESDTDNDILGNNLDYSGRVKYDFDLKSSNCLTFDGVDDYVDCGDLGSVTEVSFYIQSVIDNQEILTLDGANSGRIYVTGGVLSFGGSLTSTAITVDGVSKTASEAGALINDNEWHLVVCTVSSFTADDVQLGRNASSYGNIRLANVKFNDGVLAEYPLAEGGGSTVYDVSGNANHGTMTNFTLSNAWGTTQDVFHHNINNGFTQGKNFFSNSEDLSHPDWAGFRLTKVLGSAVEGITLTNLEASETNPNGSATLQTLSSQASGMYTFSCYAKASDSNFVLLRPSNNASFVDRVQTWFNLSTGTVGASSSPGSSFTLDSTSIELIGSDLYRCSITFTTSTLLDISARIYLTTGNNSNSVTIGDSVDVGGIQFENGELSAYQKTTDIALNGIKLPVLSTGNDDVLNLGISNPSGAFHNNAETMYAAPEAPALRVADDAKPTARLYSGANPVELGYDDFEKDFDDEGFYFSDVSTANEYKNLLIFDEEKTGSDLTDIQTFLNH